jgi:hypothetical protein
MLHLSLTCHGGRAEKGGVRGHKRGEAGQDVEGGSTVPAGATRPQDLGTIRVCCRWGGGVRGGVGPPPRGGGVKLAAHHLVGEHDVRTFCKAAVLQVRIRPVGLNTGWCYSCTPLYAR